MASHIGPPTDVASVLQQVRRPKRAVVTAGMPYANGPLHLGHLAGAHLPADIHARWLGLLIGRENVLFVCGTDDHGWTSCAYALRIENRLTAARFAYPHVLYRYLGGGHYVNLLVPYQPGEILSDLATPIGQGNTVLANANAHARLWPQLLSFLAHPRATGVFTEPTTAPRLATP